MKNIRRFLPIILLTFVNVVGFTLLIPVLTQVAQRYVAPDLVGLVYGGLLSSYAFCQFLAAPMLGSLSDKYGRKPILLLSQLGTTLSWVIFALAAFVSEDAQILGLSLPLGIILVSRVIDGLTGGNISVANAWISDVTSPKEKTAAFAILGATFGIGLLMGPAIGGLTYEAGGLLGVGAFALALSTITLISVYYKLPETLPLDKRDAHVDLNLVAQLNFWMQFKSFAANRSVSNLLKIRGFFSIVFASYVTIITLLLETQYKLGAAGVGLILSLLGVFSIFNQVVVATKLAKRIGDVNVLYTGLAAIFLGLLALALLPAEVYVADTNISLLLVMINGYFLNLGISLAQPVFKSLLTQKVSEKKQGKITGLDESLVSFGNGVTPIIAGVIYSAVQGLTFVVFALLLLVPILWIYARQGNLGLKPTT